MTFDIWFKENSPKGMSEAELLIVKCSMWPCWKAAIESVGFTINPGMFGTSDPVNLNGVSSHEKKPDALFEGKLFDPEDGELSDEFLNVLYDFEKIDRIGNGKHRVKFYGLEKT